MPGGDGTGPSGQGPMTGRKLGYCANNGQPVYDRPVYGYGRRGAGYGIGWGRGGMGRGLGWRNGMGRGGPFPIPAPYGPAPTKEQVIANLNQSKEYLQSQMDELSKEIERLNSDGGQ